MKPNSPRLMGLAFAAAVLVVMAAMGWTTRAVLRLDAAEADSRRRAQLEENVRLALWRMDSALAPLLAAEHARPVGAYQGFRSHPGGYPGYPDRGAYPGLVFDAANQAPAPAPLPGTDHPFARLYFQYLGQSAPTSPQAPAPSVRSALERLAIVAPFGRLAAALPAAAPAERADGAQSVARGPTKGEQVDRNRQEYQARALNNMQQLQVQAANRPPDTGPAAAASPAVMQPLWLGDELVLARRVAVPGNRDAVQGCWVDWPAVRGWLLASSKDLLPGAALLPLESGAAEPSARQLASLPVRLAPGDLPAAPRVPRLSPLRTSLLVAWACVLLATAAAALLLRGVVSLSERRGAFVSAVTHELRTPLTTLRMYTEMLEGGMVDDPRQRQHYLATLRAEADRLGRLVENVLAYSRLERNRAGYEVTVVELGDVVPRIAERLAGRAKQAGMTLTVDFPAEVLGLAVRANALALEQVLFNLVDNACKYAAGAADKRIELTGAATDAAVSLAVRDHGPGVAPALAKRLFLPFSKSAQEAADTAPGLGLGLSLSRRLARSMGGELWLDPSPPPTPGARFVLTLPRA